MSTDQTFHEWVYKWAPNDLNSLVLNEETKNVFKDYIKKGTLPNILLYGNAGVGKTSLAKVLVKELPNCVDIFINASKDNGIDVMRTRIQEFAEASSFGGGLKVIILDEADGITMAAQESFRGLVEANLSDTRFILTCNNINKIIDPIKSRCMPIQIATNIRDVSLRVCDILKAEKITYNKEELKLILENIVKKYYPDMRKILKHLEACCISGKFVYSEINVNSQTEEVANFIIENIKDHRKCREYWIKNEVMFGSNYIELASVLFNKLSNPEEMIKCGQKLYELNVVLDKEIGFYLMVLELWQTRK